MSDRIFTAAIADDHEIVRAGLKAALTTPGLVEEKGLTVVAEAANGLEAIEVVKRCRPDLILLDISMPMASGAEILTDLKRWSPYTRIVVLSAVTAPGLLAGLVDAGVDGLFSKASDNSELFAKLPLILRGAKYVQSSVAALIEDAGQVPDLTQRERQTLNMIVTGRTNNEIAELMGISPKTAEKHRASLMAKLEVKSAVELMARAIRDGLIERSDLV